MGNPSKGLLAICSSFSLILTQACQFSSSTPTSTSPTPGISSTLVAEIDGMVMVFVPAGEFSMGSNMTDPEADDDEQPLHAVYLTEYWIDQTEVPNTMYQRCVQADQCTPPVHSPRFGDEDYTHHPVVGVTWSQAAAYCAWAGRRLPTEAEWEKAARGTDGRIYPWGNSLPGENLLNFDRLIGDTTPVGSYLTGASPYGALDMAGNVWEWVADWYDPNYYTNTPSENPQGPGASGNLRVLRGGAWGVAARAVRAANRFWAFPERNDLDGFRCARSS